MSAEPIPQRESCEPGAYLAHRRIRRPRRNGAGPPAATQAMPRKPRLRKQRAQAPESAQPHGLPRGAVRLRQPSQRPRANGRRAKNTAKGAAMPM